MPNFNLNTERGRQEWLEERRRHIMSTDVSAILKIAPWKDATPLHVYLEKLGQYQRPDSKLKRSGRMLEDLVAADYEEETGFKVYHPDETLVVHPVYPVLAATMERLTIVGGQERHLELKTSSEPPRYPWGDSNTDAVPFYYNTQVQVAMACTGLPAAELAVRFSDGEFRHYTIRRNEDIIKAVMVAAKDFWQLVQEQRPPSIDYENPESRKLLSVLYPVEDQKEIILDGDSVGVVEVYEAARAAEKAAREQKERARAALLDRMGTASIAWCGGRQLIRAKRYKESYTVREQNYVELTVRRPKGQGQAPEYYVEEGRESA